jgi:hypothetical protein
MSRERYYGLISSLPWLAHFSEAEYLPITEKQLSGRLSGLTARHRLELDLAAALTLWPRQPRERTTDYLTERYNRKLSLITHPSLRDFVEYRTGLRTVVVALRMRYKGESPQPGIAWGVGHWTRKISAYWNDRDFRMGSVYPWIDPALRLLDQADALGLERLLFDAIWRELNVIEGRTHFGFERVFSFYFKWEIVRRWLAHDASVATNRFQTLITEVIRDHEQLFA